MNFKCNYIDAKDQREILSRKEWALEKELASVRAKKRIVEKIINQNDKDEKNWILEIPLNILPERKGDGKRLNWKEMVWRMFELYKIPMSSEMLSHKLFFHYETIPFDKKLVIRNISAALHYLETKDQKLFRNKVPGKKGYIYGYKHFFDFNFTLKPEYYQKYQQEEGKELKT